VGSVEDPALVAHRLRAPRWVTVASPAYLARRGSPHHPDELAGHACLKFVTPRGAIREWSFAGSASPRLPAALYLDQGEALIDAAAAGLGIAQVLDFMVEEPVRAGRLVEVLAEHAVAGPPIQAVYLPRKRSAPKVRAFLAFLDETISAPPGSTRATR
jgi:DNA-binding transcriptional LysR family regulator